MNFTGLIEKALEEKNMSKQALYKKVTEMFYTDGNTKQITYPSFLSRIVDNKLSAKDFFEIAEVLDINIMEVQRNVRARALRNGQRVSSYIQAIIKKESLFYDNCIDCIIMHPETDSKYQYYRVYLLCINRETMKVNLELFDFLNYSIKVISSINFRDEYFPAGDFEKFLAMKNKDKVRYLEDIEAGYKLMYPDDKDTRLLRRINIPTIEWEFDYSYTDTEDIESRIKNIYKNTKEPSDFISDFEEKLKSDIGYSIENKEEIVEINGIGVEYLIVNSAAYFDNSVLKVVNNIKIKSLVK